MSVNTIEQKIAAGSQFDGTAPTTTPATGNDMLSYPEDTVGGLFDFGNTSPILIHQIAVRLGSQSAWTIEIEDVDGIAVEVASGTNESSLLLTDLDLIVLQGQKLLIKTTGATDPMRARVTSDRQINP